MKFGFVTCVQLGKSCMEAIYEVGGKLDLAITLEDSQAVEKSGRVYLDELCAARDIPLIKSFHVNNQQCIDAINEYDIDWLFIIGWSQIANQELLASPNKGVLGIHPTLLPQGRGRASIPWAILKGLEQTGVTLFKLNEGVDTGYIVQQLIIPLNETTTATELYKKVDFAHIDLMKETIPLLMSDSISLIKQNEEQATEWPGRKPADGEIDMQGSVFEAEKLVRAVTHPYPGAFINIDDRCYIVWKAEIETPKTKKCAKVINFKDGKLNLLEFEEKPRH